VRILGINGGFGGGYQDAAAVLVVNGSLICAIEEERETRVKHSAGRMPTLSISRVLEIGKISMKEVDVVAFHGITWGNQILDKLHRYLFYTFGHCPEIHLVHHHHAHAASTYYTSPFEEALIFTVDGSGDGVSTRISIGKGNKIETLKDYYRPNSLGLFYAAVTQFCGFKRDSDEYKLMGLAAYGNDKRYDLSFFLNIKDGDYVLSNDYLIEIPPKTPSPNWQEMLFSNKLEQELSLRKRIENEIRQEYKDLAASAQYQLESVIMQMVKYYVATTNIQNVCLAGGVALNCKMNQKIMNLPEVKDLFVPPVAADMGVALGTAFVAYESLTKTRPVFNSVFCGNEYSDEKVELTLNACGITYTRCESPVVEAAALLAKNKVIGWFQGKMEYGPRALGNRSILANPLLTEMKDIVNKKIKFRESFRPFGASVLEEDMPLYFEGRNATSPYMTVVYDVKSEHRNLLQPITHADGTCRIQTVNRKQNQLFYELLVEFKKITGHGILLNTSFNLIHEPIVSTPREAVASFYGSGLEVLIINSFIVRKQF
jgi:carbamoyltransferase